MWRIVFTLASLTGLAAWGQAASGKRLIQGGGRVSSSSFVSAGPTAPLFSFASPTAFAGYRAYAGLPSTDGCYAPASVTGTKGEALTFTRATTRFCPTSANEATGVMCASGEVCITSSGSTRGISIFRSTVNGLLRSEEIDNAAWVDVGTPGTAANAYVDPSGATTAETITDDSAVAREGESQVIASTALVKHTFSVWLRASAGELEARITIVGTGNSAGDAVCSYYDGSPDGEAIETTWRRVNCTSPVAYAAGLTAVTVSVLIGDTVSETGTMGVWGGQLEHTSYVTPYVATTSASATRNAEYASFPYTAAFWPGSVSAALLNHGNGASGADAYWLTVRQAAAAYLSAQVSATSQNYCGYGNGALATDTTVSTLDGSDRVACRVTSSEVEAYLDGVGTGTPTSHSIGVLAPGSVMLGNFSDYPGNQLDGIISDVCLDPSPTRCR